jgi:hypothetical protein
VRHAVATGTTGSRTYRARCGQIGRPKREQGGATGKMTEKNGLFDGGSHVTSARRPPSVKTRRASRSARGMSGQNINPYTFVTASKTASSNSNCSASISTNRMLSRPSVCARSEATASISREILVATTVPPGRTQSAAASAGNPEPQAMSGTRAPGVQPAACRHHSAIGRKFRLVQSNHVAQPSAPRMRVRGVVRLPGEFGSPWP